MSTSPQKEWVLPAAIPFADLKRQDLEECVFWLMDAMGAKDLEWRLGGTGGGASDGGRDLEAQFYAPGADGELESQKWWIECKGRKGTVEPDEVKSAVNNALAKEGLDYLVVATNTQFSNPTRDWVKEWQRKHPRPKVKLWDASQLERYLSKHPDVVLRLFSEALSPEGRFQALETGFWNRMHLAPAGVLANLWKVRSETELTPMGIFATIVCEFANGSITQRPWGAILEIRPLLEVLAAGLGNIPYLAKRCDEAGIDQSHIFRPMAYLTLVALDRMSADGVAKFLVDQVSRGKPEKMTDEVKQMLIEPVVRQLQAELQDVCAADCSRVSMFDRAALTKGDEVEDYWARLEEDGVECVSAWNKDPVFGVIGIQSGPRH
jgi:Restriction endonuclease